MSDPKDADRTRTAVGVAEVLLGWVERWERRMQVRPDDEVPNRSRRMLVTDLARASELLGEAHDIQEFIVEISALHRPLLIVDATEQVESVRRHLCVAYNIDSRTLRPRKGLAPSRRPTRSDPGITARLPSNTDDSNRS